MFTSYSPTTKSYAGITKTFVCVRFTCVDARPVTLTVTLPFASLGSVIVMYSASP